MCGSRGPARYENSYPGRGSFQIYRPRIGASQQAEQYLRKVLASNPSNGYAARLLVSTLLKNGETDRAIFILAVALKGAPQDPRLLALAGETYMKAKDYRKATEYFEKASAIDPQASHH